MNNIIKSCLVLFIISSVCVTALAYVNEITLEPIRLQAEQSEKEANKQIFPSATDFKSGEASPPSNGTIADITSAYDGGERSGYILKLEPKGYGGTIVMLVGIDTNGVVSGIHVISHSETAGLGASCTESWFADRFKGKSQFPLSVVKSGAGESQIDAITSATITTKAVTDAVNEAHRWFESEGGSK